MFALKYYVIALNEGQQFEKGKIGVLWLHPRLHLESNLHPWFQTTVDNILNCLQVNIIKWEHQSWTLYNSKKMWKTWIMLTQI